MSTFKVETVRIDGVMKHPNADRLDLAQIKDWQCVVQKDAFKIGDTAVYFPIDSILPPEIESKIFGLDSKVRLNNSRVRTIKLRGAISQGMAIKLEVLDLDPIWGRHTEPGHDLTERFGVKKYEPPVKLAPGISGSSTRKQCNPNFRKYTGIENAKNYPSLFEEGEEVSVTEKIHGTNFRVGYVPFYADTLFKKLKSWLGLAPKWEFVYGSHNVQLQNKMLATTYYDKNVYAETVEKYHLRDVLKPGEVLYGEIYGEGIQSGYNYGLVDSRRAVFFDVRIDDKWVDTIAFRKWADERTLPFVPELYRGPFNKEKILALRDGPSVLAPVQKIREGCVVKPLKETTCYAGRKVLKFVSDEYLLKNQDNESEAH